MTDTDATTARPSLARQSGEVMAAAEDAAQRGDHARAALLRQAAWSLGWMATHASTLRSLARESQRLAALPAVAAVLDTFPGAAIVEVTCPTND